MWKKRLAAVESGDNACPHSPPNAIRAICLYGCLQSKAMSQ